MRTTRTGLAWITQTFRLDQEAHGATAATDVMVRLDAGLGLFADLDLEATPTAIAG